MTRYAAIAIKRNFPLAEVEALALGKVKPLQASASACPLASIDRHNVLSRVPLDCFQNGAGSGAERAATGVGLMPLS
jgi:hypothetical protein